MTGKKATIDDVARVAGVGRTTVSRVLNNGPNVRPEVREKVMRAVEELGFRVNEQARSLAIGAKREIALIHASDLDTEPNSYYHAGLELGAMRACAEHGFHLSNHSINQNAPDRSARVRALVAEGRYEGVILTPPFSDDVALIRAVGGDGAIVISISAGPSARAVAPSVGIDDFEAGRDIGAYLFGLGHRRFGFILGIEGHVSAEGRFEGFLKAIEQHGLGLEDIVVERGNFTFHSGIACAEAILAQAQRPTALVCANDDMAAGATLTAHKLGLDIPRDISVTGFDDTPVSEIIWPPLTTVHQPIREMGRRAAELAIEALTERERRRPAPILSLISHHIVERQSAAAPRR
ncbi:LacI family DNA-binding transcriptional regulator [Sphingosinicella sp. BN140058]|uniref:LacI family DNA-binding transcriptional regulator n=1 Tax=Sphingosinicella sp. BN140058 TaxID=1892855 RepID=UPI001012BBBB|nr:LacI family DNA-binding transcriptional regulator [Sphingosinicella sp. BN140058]QAY77470.1 LacI family DNA-binding transcriptional regulator [Sphingosinicella sp. BN140058]